MSIYERILDIDERTFDRLMSAGMLRSNAKRDLLMYEFYLVEYNKYGSMQAIANAAEKFYLSEDQAKKIIYNIKKKKLCTGF